MPTKDVIIIGGGLSGLAAAYELEQHNLDYTLIEVKRHPGGSIRSVAQDGFIFDQGTMAIANNLDVDWLGTLGLEGATFPLSSDSISFEKGGGQLIDALIQKITGPRLMRMAVSSIGELETGDCMICMENGLMLKAKSLIIALPARYAERLFYGYITPLTEILLDYQYDTIHRVSLGFPTQEIPNKIQNPPDMAYVFIHRTEHPARVPEGHTLLQFGLRLTPEHLGTAEKAIDILRSTFHLPQPTAQLVSYWAEADPISCYDDAHTARIESIHAQLPENVVLIGSDYTVQAPCHKGILNLNARIQQSREATQALLGRF